MRLSCIISFIVLAVSVIPLSIMLAVQQKSILFYGVVVYLSIIWMTIFRSVYVDFAAPKIFISYILSLPSFLFLGWIYVWVILMSKNALAIVEIVLYLALFAIISIVTFMITDDSMEKKPMKTYYLMTFYVALLSVPFWVLVMFLLFFSAGV